MKWWWVALLVVAAVPRVAGVFTDFWFDEIWSLRFASSLHSPLGIFTAIHHDNNHYLNTLFLYLLGDGADWRWYRLLSLAAGIASVPVAVLVGRLRSFREGWIAGVLFAASYPFIFYSSEARGYAPMILCALLCFYLLQRRRYFLFSCVAAIGLLAQLTLLEFYLAAIGLTLLRLRRRPLDLLRCHLLPCTLLLALYWIDIRRMTLGGGPQRAPMDVVQETATLALGLPERGAFGIFSLCTVAIILLLAWWRFGRERSDLGHFYEGAIVIAPALLYWLGPTPLLYPRYFLAPLAFFLLLFASLLARLGPTALAAVLVLYCVGNAAKVSLFLREGRGHYADAVQYIASHSPRGPLTVGSNHDYQVSTILRFYARRAGADITYVRQGASQEPQWFVYRAYEPDAAPLPNDNGFVLEETLRYWGLSGATWFLYRHHDP